MRNTTMCTYRSKTHTQSPADMSHWHTHFPRATRHIKLVRRSWTGKNYIFFVWFFRSLSLLCFWYEAATTTTSAICSGRFLSLLFLPHTRHMRAAYVSCKTIYYHVRRTVSHSCCSKEKTRRNSLWHYVYNAWHIIRPRDTNKLFFARACRMKSVRYEETVHMFVGKYLIIVRVRLVSLQLQETDIILSLYDAPRSSNVSRQTKDTRDVF